MLQTVNLKQVFPANSALHLEVLPLRRSPPEWARGPVYTETPP